MFSSQNSQVSNDAVFVEDVFSTYLYTGNGTSQTITNGIDLSTKGGLVWSKRRNVSLSNLLFDTVRGNTKYLVSNTTGAEGTDSPATYLTSFNSNGFSVGAAAATNNLNDTYASWTFRKQPKFFDVVTYTGNGVNSPQRNISHSLGSAPGCVIIKATSTTSDWGVWHRGSGGSNDLTGLSLNTTAAATQNPWGESASFNSSTFAPYLVKDASNNGFNTNGVTYVAYLFAHNAGGFGLTGTDNVISCGSYTTDGSGNFSVNLGYEPQWIMAKRVSSTGDWTMFDTMRGLGVDGTSYVLYANVSNAESGPNNFMSINSTGFGRDGGTAGQTFIYIAIRRGPMKVPTSGTSVFSPVARTGTSASANVTAGFAPDLLITDPRATGDRPRWWDRLRGANLQITSNNTNAENTATDAVNAFNNTTLTLGADVNNLVNQSGSTYINWIFRRAPSFFDEVCYTGTGSATTVTHNLGVVPEMIIAKNRNSTYPWGTYHSALGTSQYVRINSTAASDAFALFPSVSSTTFGVSADPYNNGSGLTYVAYLFASCPGVSKVGSYTGTGTTLQVNCGFTGGARFVLIKRTDSTGDWYVWDSARGIVSGNDPYLLLNSTAAEVTSTDYIDTYSAGFEISSTAPAAINASGGTFIFLAIA